MLYKKTISLNDEEKKVFSFLSSSKDFEINEIKNNSGLSNKKWDKTLKFLTKNKLAKVVKNDNGLFVELL